ncbi:Rap1a/Tai family immunity protein [Methylobacter sp.]|uniref:Rap1a/Tai family immunity protein n=1 Tax=Methylobacter sp. TaxID=2051955 RepID=UPI001219F084|nr:Rap1a/Tai family immunity protein [Methylobacter sp.]TAK63374.1 MAG: hypothetical protein EPO18_07150 [Methylobacter sp.]
MKAAKLILIAIMTMPMSANAGFNAFIDGHKLHDKSRAYKSGDIDDADLYDAGAYVYYIMGVIDSNIGSGLFCPQNITSDQAANVVTKYLNEHPQSLDSSGEALVKAALAQEWPCPK